MRKNIEDLKKELVIEIKALAADIASANSYVGLLANEIKFGSLQEKFINLKFLERKRYGLEIFESDIGIIDDIEDDYEDIQIPEPQFKRGIEENKTDPETPEITQNTMEQGDSINNLNAVSEKPINVESENNIKDKRIREVENYDIPKGDIVISADKEPKDEIQPESQHSEPDKRSEFSKVTELKIDYNDHLAFKHQLFDGDEELMRMVIRTLNSINSKEDSHTYMSDLQKEMDWQEKEEYVERLVELVNNRFE